MGITTNQSVKMTFLSFTSHMTMKGLNPGCLKFVISIWLYTCYSFQICPIFPLYLGQNKKKWYRKESSWVDLKTGLTFGENMNITWTITLLLGKTESRKFPIPDPWLSNWEHFTSIAEVGFSRSGFLENR